MKHMAKITSSMLRIGHFSSQQMCCKTMWPYTRGFPGPPNEAYYNKRHNHYHDERYRQQNWENGGNKSFVFKQIASAGYLATGVALVTVTSYHFWKKRLLAETGKMSGNFSF